MAPFFVPAAQCGAPVCVILRYLLFEAMATLTKDEFKVLLMLYASNIDCVMQDEEVELMIEKSDPIVFAKMHKLYRQMGDVEVLSCINLNKGKYLATEEATVNLMNDIRAVVFADGRSTPVEQYFVTVIKKILG